MSFDPAALRAQFPILRQGGLHYLDNAATAQMPQPVLDAVISFETTQRANVKRGMYRLAEAADAAYENAREQAAAHLNARAEEIVFTSGTTGGLNLLAQGLGDALQPGDEILLTQLEHHSNIVPWQMLAQRKGLRLRFLPVNDQGLLDMAQLDDYLSPKCRIIAVTHCSNVTGEVIDITRFSKASRSIGAALVVDGAQAAPHGPIDVAALGADFYVFSGHKCFGPTGIGVLWGKAERLEALPPVFGGGGMIRRVTEAGFTAASGPARFEAGTPPIAQAIGLGAALRWMAQIDWKSALAHELALAQRLLDGLGRIRNCRILGPTGLQQRLPVVSFALGDLHSHDICHLLDEHGIALRGGHHCAQPLMQALGLTSTTRASIAVMNDASDIDALLNGLEDVIKRLR